VTRVYQTDFSAQQPGAQTPPWLSFAYGDQERPQDSCASSGQGPQAPQRLGLPDLPVSPENPDRNATPLSLERLRVRREFLYVADGQSDRRRLVVVQARRRPAPRDAAGAGFTSTRKIGNAVVRNRARRRLREGVRLLLPSLGLSGVDYVFIARQETGECPWPRLLDDMETALVSLRRRLLAGGEPRRTPASSRPTTKG
jgi:ribonuclease P protein component